MRYLLYCILDQAPANQNREELWGVLKKPVALITKNGLSAAVSMIAGVDLTPDLSTLRAYGKVIESFHRVQAVIPMRFGCWLQKKSQVIGLLEENLEQYKGLLKKLKGCVEMGIRFLPQDESPRLVRPLKTDSSSGNPAKENPAFTDTADHPGPAYLAARKTYYDEKDRSVKNNGEVIERCRKAFSGLYLQCKTESPPTLGQHLTFRSPLLSLYFLVPGNSVESFRRVFRQIGARESAKLLLTGPWPPYNFVMLEEAAKSHQRVFLNQ